MNDDRECALNNSLSAGDGYRSQSQTPPLNTAGLPARPPRLTAGWAGRNLIRTAVMSAIVAMGVLGFGVVGAVGEASAKPMERERVRYCTKLTKDVIFTINAYHKAVNLYGEDDVLTRQAASNSERAQNRYADSGC